MANVVKTVQIVVEAKDAASKTLGAIGHTLSTAIGGFVGGAALKAASAGFDALTGAIGDCIQESRDAAHGLAQTEAVIKSTGGKAKVTAKQIVALSGALSRTTLFTDDAIQAQQNLLLTFTNIRNEAGDTNDIFDQTSKIGLDMAQALGTDAAGAAVQLGKALNDPIKGISALSRVGVTFTDQQKAQIKTMVESGDLMSAQKVILAELTAEFGGSAEAAARADGGFHLFNQRLSDVKQTIGDALMPVLNDLMGWLSGPGLDAVEAWGTGVATWITNTAIPGLKAGIKTVQDVIKGFQSGNFSAAKLDLWAWFGADRAGQVTAILQDIRKGWGLARDSLITFKEALAGAWKDADVILPLHRAIGDLGTVLHTVLEWATNVGFPAFKLAVHDSIPKVQADMEALRAWAMARFFPDMHDGMVGLTGDMRESRDTSGKTWAETRDAMLSAVAEMQTGIDFYVARLDAWRVWFLKTFGPDIDGAFRSTQKTAMDVLTVQLPKFWATAIGDAKEAWFEINSVLMNLRDAWLRLKAAIFGGSKGGGTIIGSGTPGGQSVIGAQVQGFTARGGPLALPSGFAAPPSSSVAPSRAPSRPALTVDLRGSTFGAGLTEPQVRGWIAPLVDDALERWETGIRRQIGDLDTRGALR